MTDTDKLFRQVVLKEPFLRNRIYYHVCTALNCRTINYKFCVKLSILLQNNYFELIKLKLQNKEYLYLDGMDGITQLFRLKDLDLFIAIFNQLNDQDYEFINSLDALNLCVELQHQYQHDNNTYDNKALEYLLFGQQRLVFEKSLEFYKSICIRGYLGIIKRLKSDLFNGMDSKQYTLIFYPAIQSKNILLVKELYNKSLFNGLEIYNKEMMLAESVKTGSIEIFTLVSEYFADSFFFFQLRRKDFYTNNLLGFLFGAAVKGNSFDMYMHLINTFDMSFLRQHKMMYYENPFLLAVQLPTNEIIEHLINNNLLSDDYATYLCLSAMQRGKYALFQQLKTYFKDKILGVPHAYQMASEVDPPFNDLSRVEYILDTLKVPIKVMDIIRSAQYPQTFKYLFERYNKAEMPNLYAQINTIVSYVCMYNTPEVLLYLHNEHAVDFTKTRVWTSLCIPPLCSLKTLQIAITIYPPTQDIVPTLSKVLEYFAQNCKTNNISMFELLFDIMYNGPSALTRDPNDYIGAFRGAIRGGRILTLQYLYNQGLTIPTEITYIELLKEAAQYGSLSIIKYILEHQQQYSIPLTPLKETSMKAHKYDCVDYLLPKEVSQTLTIKELVQYCTNYINIQESQLMS